MFVIPTEPVVYYSAMFCAQRQYQKDYLLSFARRKLSIHTPNHALPHNPNYNFFSKNAVGKLLRIKLFR